MFRVVGLGLRSGGFGVLGVGLRGKDCGVRVVSQGSRVDSMAGRDAFRA